MLSLREQLSEARYDLKAWSQGVAWGTVCIGLGMVFTGLGKRDATLFSSGVALTISAFLPRANARWVYEIARTWTMKQGWIAVPREEQPFTFSETTDAKP